MGRLVKSLDLESATSNRRLDPIYLVMGEDDYLRDRALRVLKQAVLGGTEDGGFNCDLFYGDEHTAEEVITCAMELPVFAERRLVILKQADKWSAREAERCLEYILTPHESTTLVLTACKLDRRLKWTQALLREAVVVDCDALAEAPLLTWIRQEAATLGLTVQEEAAHLLKELAAGSLYALRRELEKLSAYVPAGRPASVADVEALRGTEPGASVFDLTLAIADRNVGRAWTILARNLEAGEAPLRILGALVWQYRRLWKVKDTARQSSRPAEAGRAFRMDPAKAAALLSEFSESHLQQAFRLFMEADSQLKGGSSGSPKRVLENVLLALCQRPGTPQPTRRDALGHPERKPARSKPVSNVRTVRTGKR